ncbi:MAG: hypothetical protein M1818_001857 [Claussenomyces sp. TS43310]|nr:MAG: hypothetical protein M1818_001857 [Claussenomyces sp. TS43310]
MHGSMAMELAHCAGLTSEDHLMVSDVMREERRRCFWSCFTLKRLHGANFSVLDFTEEENFPWYPSSTKKPSFADTRPDAPLDGRPSPEDKGDAGIVAYAIQLSEVWFRTTKYGRRRGKPSKLPPWSPQSEYATIMAQQMDFETRTPDHHRFKPAGFSSRSPEELHEHREYWGPWLFIQFLYHTSLCLLNHLLLLALRLRTLTTQIPEIFLQHTSDLTTAHASWIVHYIDMLEVKSFEVSDPFLGHCAAVVATIYLQESVHNSALREERQINFAKCLKFVHRIGEQWPHIERIARKLEGLKETVSATSETRLNAETPNRGLLIDLGCLWEILEYSSSSDNSSGQLFGPSLSQGHPHERREVFATSALPEPTRLDTASHTRPATQRRAQSMRTEASPAFDLNDLADTALGTGSPLNVTAFANSFAYSNDELAVLAESFFYPRGLNETGSTDNWGNTGNL